MKNKNGIKKTIEEATDKKTAHYLLHNEGRIRERFRLGAHKWTTIREGALIIDIGISRSGPNEQGEKEVQKWLDILEGDPRFALDTVIAIKTGDLENSSNKAKDIMKNIQHIDIKTEGPSKTVFIEKDGRIYNGAYRVKIMF